MTRTEFLRLVAGAASAWAAPRVLGATPAQTERMHARPIPSTREALPVIGCGTWRTFDVGPTAADRAPLADVLQILFANGGSVIDSSPMYGAAEAVVGDVLATMRERDKAFIATKVWTTGRDSGIAQMKRSMELLRTERIDLLQVHNLVDWQTQLATLRAWKKEGRIRYLGITHYTPSAYPELESVMRSRDAGLRPARLFAQRSRGGTAVAAARHGPRHRRDRQSAFRRGRSAGIDAGQAPPRVGR